MYWGSLISFVLDCYWNILTFWLSFRSCFFNAGGPSLFGLTSLIFKECKMYSTSRSLSFIYCFSARGLVQNQADCWNLDIKKFFSLDRISQLYKRPMLPNLHLLQLVSIKYFMTDLLRIPKLLYYSVTWSCQLRHFIILKAVQTYYR